MHALRDLGLHEEFGTITMDIDLREPHRYAVDWREDGVDVLVDGRVVRRSQQSPDYPMQLEIAVVEFPGRGEHRDPPELIVHRVGARLA